MAELAVTETYIDRIQKLQAASSIMGKGTKRFNALLYGIQGTGKTVLAMHLAQVITPVGKKIVHVDTSEGWVSLENHPQLMPRTIHVRYEGLNQLATLAEVIEQGIAGYDNVGTIIIDELSTVSSSVLQEVAIYREDNPGPGGNKLVEGAIDQRDYGIVQNLVIRVFRRFVNIPQLQIIVVAHERSDGEANEIKRIGPAFPAGLMGALSGYFIVVGRVTTDIKKAVDGTNFIRKVQVHPTVGVTTKSRVGGLPTEVLPNDLVGAIKEWIKGERGDDNNQKIEVGKADAELTTQEIQEGIKVI